MLHFPISGLCRATGALSPQSILNVRSGHRGDSATAVEADVPAGTAIPETRAKGVFSGESVQFRSWIQRRETGLRR